MSLRVRLLFLGKAENDINRGYFLLNEPVAHTFNSLENVPYSRYSILVIMVLKNKNVALNSHGFPSCSATLHVCYFI